MADPFLAYVGLALTVAECLAFLWVTWVGSRPDATRQAWAGIRLEATMTSDEAWRAAHRVAFPKAVLACVSLLPVASITIFFVTQAAGLITLIQWALAAAALGWIVWSTAMAVRAAQAVK